MIVTLISAVRVVLQEELYECSIYSMP
jgi:hypothetical protein